MKALLKIISHVLFAALALGFPHPGTLEISVAGLALLAVTVLFAAHLLLRDSTPASGVTIFTAALAAVSIRLLGGSFSPAVVVYPLLFAWMKMPSISGSLYYTGIIVSISELLGHLAPGWGSSVAVLNLLPGALAAFAAPFLSMLGADLLLESRGFPAPEKPERLPPGGESPAFPEDVARSLLPLLQRATGANGVFLVVRDGECYRLSDYLVSAGTVASHFMPDSSDPFLTSALGAEGIVTLDITSKRRLPWYISDPGTASVVMTSLTRGGVPGGFVICDFFSSPAPVEAGDILLDAAGALGSAWEVNTGPTPGMLAETCLELGSVRDLKAAVHAMVVGLSRHLPGVTVTVAVLTPDARNLQVYETLGYHGSRRRGRLFPADRGMAGWAVSNRKVAHRKSMARGDMSIRPFTPDEDPDRQVGSCCAVPLYSERSVFGVLVVESPRESGITPEHARQFEALSSVFGLFSARMVAIQRLQALSRQDSITGLPLYADFQDDLHGLVTEVRKGMSVAVLAVDIVGFRALNREYGIRTCDAILAGASERIAAALGQPFMMTRCSPGRFLVSIPGADRAAAQAYAVKIMEAFSIRPFELDGRDVPVAVAAGGAASRVDRMVLRLSAYAEEALKKAHSKGAAPLVLSVDQFGKTPC